MPMYDVITMPLAKKDVVNKTGYIVDETEPSR